MLKIHPGKVLTLLAICLGLAALLINTSPILAIDINSRSITPLSVVPSAVTTHTFQFSLPTTNNVGSIIFNYCDNSPIIYEACTPPTGLSVSAANLASQSGNVGFSIDNADSTANKIVLSRPSAPGTLVPST